MDCHRIADLLPDYLQNSLNAAESRIVEEHVRACAECREDVELWQRLESIHPVRPAETLRARFEEMLAAYREGLASQPRQRTWFTTHVGARWAQAAAVLALVAIVFTAGMFVGRGAAINTTLTAMQQELTTTRQLVTISLLQNQSASDRLEGVNWSTRLPQPTPQLVEALLERLSVDSSVDVRLAALDALRRNSGEPAVRGAVRNSLTHQQSPMVQIAVVDFLVDCRDHSAVDQLKTFESRTDLLPEVRQKVQWGITRLNRG